MSNFLDINTKIQIIRVSNNNNNNNNNNSTNNNNNGLKNDLERLNLPKPSFRQLETYNHVKNYADKKEKKAAKKEQAKRKESYYHYEEPSADELFKRVEYDMDLEDRLWLEKFNASDIVEKGFSITENDFEKVMDRLEKESYFESQKSGNNGLPKVDEDAVCAICDDGDCHNANAILFCDMCDLAVHQECYGVPYIPEGQWLCRRCLNSPLRNVTCILCPNMGGAFKQTEDKKWAHVICALWIPEVCFANTVFLEPIDGIDQIPAARWRLNCYICKQRKVGACIQCHKQNCYQPFHVTCAQQAGLYMRISTCKYPDDNGGWYTDVKKEAYCDMHTPPGGKCGGGMYSGDDTDEDFESEAYKKKSLQRKKQIKKTRKLLEERREHCSQKATAHVKVDSQKFLDISKLISFKGKSRGSTSTISQLRLKYVEHIHTYWQLKRIQRNGVPLLRRLQVSYYNSSNQERKDSEVPVANYTSLRYDLEKCRLLIGEVKKRELLKKKMFQLSWQVIEEQIRLFEESNPPENDG